MKQLNYTTMKHPISLLLLFSAITFHAQPVLSYEEGLAQCTRMREELTRENPNAMPYIPPSCIQGTMLPEFETTTMEGVKVSNRSLEGRVSIINFWFIACPPCVAEIPGLNAIVEKYGADQINYIAIGRDSEENIRDFLNENPWKFQIMADSEYLMNEIFKIRWGYPTTLVVNQKGEIVFASSGGKTDETAVDEVQEMLVPVINQLIE